MIQTILPYNPLLRAMSYKPEQGETYGILTLVLKKGKVNENRTYNSSRDVAYKLFYSKSGQECINTFNNLIKNKLTLISVV